METEINFKKLDGLVPCIVQDYSSDKVLMLGFMNEEALSVTRNTKKVTFYSRTKQRLWTKGESSGHYLELVSLMLDCDRDSLLIKARTNGPVCHTGADTCFQEKNTVEGIEFLEKIIRERIQHPKEGSYTNHLLAAGINKVAQKVGEEAIELVIEAKDNSREKFLNEAADLMYHYFVLLAAKELSINDVTTVLRNRHKE
jgi:phosphoribosyl-ATP pyrophosphohydrolase/phosphoribosyl-AMP cyclohydrolase